MSDNPIFDSLYNKTLRFLSFRPRSEKEILDYLKKKKASEKNTQDIISRLREYRFVDDSEFAKWYIENRKKGSRLILMELKQKGISKDIIDQILKDLDLGQKDSLLIQKLMEKKWKTISKYPKEKSYEKMISFLMRRGFDYEKAKIAFREFSGKQFDD